MATVIGPIVELQIQRSQLKIGEKGARVYHTDPIVAVERLRVSREGIIGVQHGTELLDAHHRDHPLHKNDDGVHGVSVGFTSHYGIMQRRFGPHLRLGCAGENIIVQSERRFELPDVERGFVILDQAERPKGRLEDIAIAHPCKPFTGFAHRNEVVAPEVLKESLQFLDGGLRGFYCTWVANEEPAIVERGDLLALINP
jgi:hypothetical protein